MEIREWREDKKLLLPLLLTADEEEKMIDRYLDRGTMFVCIDAGSVKGECVVTDEGGGIIEIKNIAVEPLCRKKGYGRALIEFVAEHYKSRGSVLQVGTGESPATAPFYEKCGFTFSHRVKDFFTAFYSRPLYDGGVLLTDMVYFRRKL